MKNFLKVFILAAGLVLCLNASSFASIDLAVYGGYGFSGTAEMKVEGKKLGDGDYSATQFGVKGHYNLELSPAVDLGLGAFYQYAKIDPDEGGGPKPTRNSLGVDVVLIFSVASMPELFPYVRGYFSFYDKIKYKEEGESISPTGHGFGIGGGFEYEINQNVRFFGEFMYENASLDKTIDGGYIDPVLAGYDFKFEMDASQVGINIGLKYLI